MAEDTGLTDLVREYLGGKVHRMTTDGIMLVDLKALRFGKSAAGNVSGYERIMVETETGKAIAGGAITIYAPSDKTVLPANVAPDLTRTATRMLLAGRHAEAQAMAQQAEAEQAKFDAAVKASKTDWQNRTAWEALLTRAGVGLGYRPSDTVHEVAADQRRDEPEAPAAE